MMNDPTPTRDDEEVLSVLREKIDRVDHQLVEMLNTRAQLVVEVGKLKRGSGIPIYAPHREAAVLAKVIGLSKGPLPERTIEAIYREMMSGSFFLEQPLRIGFIGPEGSNGQLAAMKHFGASVEYENLRATEGAFTEVARGHVDYALVPIENTSGGGITETLDAFSRYHDSVSIYGEVQLEVHHSLLSNSPPNQIKSVYGSRTGLAHCRQWLAVQFPQAELHRTATTLAAVEAVLADQSAGRATSAAIGSTHAGNVHGLHALFPDIEDDPNNITRFLILSTQRAQASGNDKTSIMFATADKPGALVEVLSVFHHAGINLTHIDKRPSGRENWDYQFFIDAQGHRDDPDFAKAIEAARQHCRDLTELGSYPASQRVL